MPTFNQIESEMQKYTVGIAGVGGLGSNIAMALVRVGIGKLVIADFDVVSDGNLNRQFYFKKQLNQKKVVALKENLLEINPDAQIEVHDITLDRTNIIRIYSSVDVMVEAFDKAEMKEIIIELFQSDKPKIPLVVGNGMAGWGESNSMRVEQFGNLYVCGDGESEINLDLPPMAPRVGICAAMQANVVISILLANSFGTKNL